jgi:sugar/nucleoside kinase (ribokinase family)
MTYDLLVVGRPSYDIIFTGLGGWPEPGRELYASGVALRAGGAINLAAAAHRLGLEVGFVGLLGNDPASDFLMQEIESEGLPTELLRRVDAPLPAVSVAFNLNGDRGFVTHEAEAEWLERELLAHAMGVLSRPKAARHVHMDLRPSLVSIAREARGLGMTVSIDTQGWDPWLVSDAASELLPSAEVLLTNEPEALAMTGANDPHEALIRLARLSSSVVIKMGPRGVIAAVEGQILEVPTEPVVVVDATGAGDCFNAGYLYAWLRGLPTVACLTVGNLCGGRAVQAVGGYTGCPREAELHQLAGAAGLDIPVPEVLP